MRPIHGLGGNFMGWGNILYKCWALLHSWFVRDFDMQTQGFLRTNQGLT